MSKFSSTLKNIFTNNTKINQNINDHKVFLNQPAGKAIINKEKKDINSKENQNQQNNTNANGNNKNTVIEKNDRTTTTTTITTTPIPPQSRPSARVPLSSIVSCLVEEWSRSYTIEAMKGDVESMCMLAQGHLSKNGYGCIPHDIERGKEWMEKAKKQVIEDAKKEEELKNKNKIAAAAALLQTEAEALKKSQDLEKSITTENVFDETEVEEQSILSICIPLSEQPLLDDSLSSGSSSVGSICLSTCDQEGGETAGLVFDIQLELNLNESERGNERTNSIDSSSGEIIVETMKRDERS